MQKKGQVTVFIILGIIILFLTALILFISNKLIKEEAKVEYEKITEPFSTDVIQHYVDSCVKRTVEEGVVFNSLQGGYYQVPEPAVDQILVKIPYYFNLGEEKFLEKKIMEKELEEYVEEELPKCLDNFTVFKKQGYDIKEGEIEAKADLGRRINVEVSYPLTISRDAFVKEIKNFGYLVKVDFEKVYSVLNETVFEHQENPNYVPVGFISLAADENDFVFELTYLEDDVVVYSYVFDQYKIDEESYVFIFSGRYNWSDLKPEKEVWVAEIEDQHCYVGDVCKIFMWGEEGLTYEDFTELFDISSDGIMDFIPKQRDIGNYNILIKASDVLGNEKYVSFGLEILALNNPPEIMEIEDQIAKVNESFIYQVEAVDYEEDEIAFYDDTELFNISNTGLINFTAQNESIGFYIIEITAWDGEFNATEWMYLTIENE